MVKLRQISPYCFVTTSCYEWLKECRIVRNTNTRSVNTCRLYKLRFTRTRTIRSKDEYKKLKWYTTQRLSICGACEVLNLYRCSIPARSTCGRIGYLTRSLEKITNLGETDLCENCADSDHHAHAQSIIRVFDLFIHSVVFNIQ